MRSSTGFILTLGIRFSRIKKINSLRPYKSCLCSLNYPFAKWINSLKINIDTMRCNQCQSFFIVLTVFVSFLKNQFYYFRTSLDLHVRPAARSPCCTSHNIKVVTFWMQWCKLFCGEAAETVWNKGFSVLFVKAASAACDLEIVYKLSWSHPLTIELSSSGTTTLNSHLWRINVSAVS